MTTSPGRTADVRRTSHHSPLRTAGSMDGPTVRTVVKGIVNGSAMAGTAPSCRVLTRHLSARLEVEILPTLSKETNAQPHRPGI